MVLTYPHSLFPCLSPTSEFESDTHIRTPYPPSLTLADYFKVLEYQNSPITSISGSR